MRYTDNAMSAILLCSYLGINKDSEIKPFTLSEWNKFLDRIIASESEPGIILKQNFKDEIKSMSFSESEINRIEKLASRGGVVAMELDDLSRKGIEVITLLDKEYPILLRKRLKKRAPVILYYAGDLTLSQKIGIAVVGSRNIDDAGISFTKDLVKRASLEHIIIYSGGARGVDTVSELTAIENGSAVVSYVADSLLTKIKRREVVKAIQENKLLLLSDVKPDVGFSTARAMNRNKFIYASSYGAFAIASDFDKGGTWAGAVENLRNKWVKMFVWENPNYSGNSRLIEKGAIAYKLNNEKIYDLIMRRETKYEQQDLFSYKGSSSHSYVMESDAKNAETQLQQQYHSVQNDMYDVVKDFIVEKFKRSMTVDEACESMNVAKGQMKLWIKRLCDEKKLKKQDGKYICN